MSIIPWIRKVCDAGKPWGRRHGDASQTSPVCHDTLTRLDSRELAALQDAGRNCSIAARASIKAAMRHMLKANLILDEMERRMREAGEQ